LSDFTDLYKAFCFSDNEASQFHTPKEHHCFLSKDECVCSFLACATFIRGADPVTSEPIFGKPVLTVIHAPAVALAGKGILGEELWPNVPFLSPIGWRWPDGLLYLFAGSIAVASHEFSSSTTMQCTHSTFLESVVIHFEAIPTFSSNALASLLEHRVIFVRCSGSLQGICFSDDEASQFRTPEECYHFLSDDERVCSFLACAKFVHGADPLLHEPLFGKPVLTAIYALAVALAGKGNSGEACMA
jgi:hypothetical protein